MCVKVNIKRFLPREKGPGFISTPDIIKSFWVTLDRTKRYDNIIKDSIRVSVFNLLPMDANPALHTIFLPENVPIVDLYWLMSIELAPMMLANLLNFVSKLTTKCNIKCIAKQIQSPLTTDTISFFVYNKFAIF